MIRYEKKKPKLSMDSDDACAIFLPLIPAVRGWHEICFQAVLLGFDSRGGRKFLFLSSVSKPVHLISIGSLSPGVQRPKHDSDLSPSCTAKDISAMHLIF